MQPRDHQGFPDAESLALARAMLDQARGFERAELSLRGLDAFFDPSGAQAKLAPHGVVFGPCSSQDLRAGLSGALGRHLLKIAHTAPARAAMAPHQDDLSAPSPCARNSAPEIHASLAAPPAPDPSREVPEASNADYLDLGEEFDPDAIDEDEDAHAGFSSPTTLEPAWTALEPAAPMSMEQIKAMMTTGSALAERTDLFEQELFEIARAPAHGVLAKRPSWDAWGGLARKRARSVGARLGLRHEVHPDPAEPDAGLLGLFPIDPGPLPAQGSEAALSDPDFEKAVEARLRECLAQAHRRALLCGASAVILCGWGSRLDMALRVAEELGLGAIRLT